MEDLISIVIPVYNVEDFLDRCVDSVIKQTYANLEIILVNDGSTDSSGLKCDEIALRDARVRVIHKKNNGLSSARNFGIESAKGKYISFLDSDDWVKLNYIEVLIDQLVTSNSDISICNYEKIYSEDTEIIDVDLKNYIFDRDEALENLTGRFNNQMVPAWGSLYKIEVFQNVRYPEGKIHEDEFVAHKVLYAADSISLTTEKLLYYWQREDSIMGQGFNANNRLNAVEALVDRVYLLDSLNLTKAKENTFRSIFILSQSLYHHKDELGEQDRIDFLSLFNDLKRQLRKGNYAISFKILYEVYYIFPKFTGNLLNMHLNRKR